MRPVTFSQALMGLLGTGIWNTGLHRVVTNITGFLGSEPSRHRLADRTTVLGQSALGNILLLLWK